MEVSSWIMLAISSTVSILYDPKGTFAAASSELSGSRRLCLRMFSIIGGYS